jgi:hypothetical protein
LVFGRRSDGSGVGCKNSSIMIVPPPEERICEKHKRPITPSQWKQGCRKAGCSRCCNEWNVKYRIKRVERKGLPRCRNHPKKKASRSVYLKTGKRMCMSCYRNRTPEFHDRQMWWKRSRRLYLKIQENKI